MPTPDPQPAPSAPAIPPLGLAALLTSSTFSVMAGAILSPAINLIRDQLSLSVTQAGLVLSTHALFTALSSPLWGWLIDRIGPKRPFMLGLFLFALAGGFGFWANDFWSLAASRAALGLAVGAFFNAITVIILSIDDPRRRMRVMGWRGSGNSMGGTLWPMLGGALGALSWRLPFAVYLVGIPLALAGWRTLPDHIGRKARPSGAAGPGLVRVIAERPLLLAVYMLMLLWSVLLYLIVIFIPQVLETKGIDNPFVISLFISCFMLASAVTSMFFASLAQRLSKPIIATGVICLWATLLTGISFLPSPPWLALACACFGVGMGSLLPTLMLWVGELAPSHMVGRVSSLLGSCTFVGMFFSPLIFGPLAPHLGLAGVFRMGSLLCLGVLGLLWLAQRYWGDKA